MSGSGISWAICKSAPCSRQITTPAPHRSVFLQAGCPSCRPTNSVKALKTKHVFRFLFSECKITSLLTCLCCCTVQVPVIVHIIDANDNPPEFTQNEYGISVLENRSVFTPPLFVEVGSVVFSFYVSGRRSWVSA